MGGAVVYSANGNTDAVSAEVSPPALSLSDLFIPLGTVDVAAYVANHLSQYNGDYEIPEIDLSLLNQTTNLF